MGYPIQNIQIRDFSGGLNCSELYTKMAANQGQVATNVMLDGLGRLRPRYAVRNHTRFSTAISTTHYINGIRLLASWDRGGTKKWAIVDDGGELFYASGNGSVPADGSWSWDSGGTVGGDDRYCSVSYKGYLYIGGKTKSIIDRTDASTSADGGLTVPSTIPTTLTPTTGGNMEEKTYYYRFAVGYGSSDELGISYWKVSDTSVIVTAGNTAVDITLPSLSGLNHANQWHVWRGYGDGDPSGPFYYVGSGAGGGTFSDVYGDWELGTPMDKYENGYPPQNCACLAVHLDRMWYANAKGSDGTDRPMRMFYSEIGQADFVPTTNYIEISGQRGDQILWIESYRGALIVFTKNDIWALSGSSSDNFSVSRIATGTSCLSGYSVVNCDGLLVFIGPDGFYGCDGVSVRRIAPQFNLKNAPNFYAAMGAGNRLSAVYDGIYGNYILVSYTGSQGLILDVKREAVFEMVDQSGIGRYGLDGGQLFSNPPDSSIATREIYIACYNQANSRGCISKLNDASGEDQGYNNSTGNAETDNIDCAFTSAGMDGTDFDTTKAFRGGVVNFSEQPNTASLALYGDAVSLVSNSTVAATMRVPGIGTGARRLALGLVWECTSSKLPRINDAAFWFTEFPKRME